MSHPVRRQGGGLLIKVNIVCVGKLKESYWREAVAEYAKRLGAYCVFSVVELSESKLPDHPSEKQIADGLEKRSGRDDEISEREGRAEHSDVHRGQRAEFGSLSGAPEQSGGRGHIGGEFLHRLVIRLSGAGKEDVFGEAFDVADDVSAPAGAGNALRAGIPCLFDKCQRKISQVTRGA